MTLDNKKSYPYGLDYSFAKTLSAKEMLEYYRN